MTVQPQELVKRSMEIPSLPLIFTRIDEAVNNPRSSLADIGKIISEDSSLIARLLQIVNSALYNFPSKIETISRAVTIVGTQQLRDLALATSVMKLFRGIPENLLSMEDFWRHSIACGVAARVLASLRREANVERFFVAGILHDIGRLILFLECPDSVRPMLSRCKENCELLYIVESEEFGFDHAAAGRVALQNWKLPSSLEEIVACHHDPAAASRYPLETALIHIADILTHSLELGNSGERLVPPMNNQAWERAGLSPSELSGVMKEVDRHYHEAIQWILPETA